MARPEAGDVSEDVAAAEVAAVVAGDGVHVDHAFTGRANLFAETAGVLVVDRDGIDGLNAVDPAITFATLDAFAPVVAGKMIATVKIIPFAVPGDARDRAVAIARVAKPLVRVAPYRVRKVAVISTVLPGLADKVIDKTLRVTADRLAPSGARIIAEKRVPHETGALAAAIKEVLAQGAELAVVFGASAIADRRDVIPAAVEAVGGTIEHFGMPVDPGNLMLVSSVGGHPVLGAPGCARSPKENGFDWILARLLCGLPVTRHDITGMGVGGLLMEIVTRPQPREIEVKPGRRVAAIVLAAGRSTRMGGPNKLLGRYRWASAGAHRGRGGARLAGAPGRRRHRASARAGRGGARRARCHLRAQSGFRRRSVHVAEEPGSRRSGPMSTARSSASATCRRSTPN